ncbi:MAG: N-acetyltransferase, partial [Deltaproteobacteria bacterium]|nr:N-acetyltransferase [Deltaproteobacteria bacterium]
EGFGDFDGFVGRFNHKRRKELLRERRQVREAGIGVQVLRGNDVSLARGELELGHEGGECIHIRDEPLGHQRGTGLPQGGLDARERFLEPHHAGAAFRTLPRRARGAQLREARPEPGLVRCAHHLNVVPVAHPRGRQELGDALGQHPRRLGPRARRFPEHRPPGKLPLHHVGQPEDRGHGEHHRRSRHREQRAHSPDRGADA